MTDCRRFPSDRQVAAALLVALPGVVAAQTAAPLPALPTITVIGKLEQPLAEIAASVIVLDTGQIDRTLAQDARQLFRFEPGISVGSDPNRFGLGAISIRGLGGNRVLLETDGVPAPSGFAVGSFADTGRPLTDLGVVDRVEVLRGPASSLYGSDALAGVIALRTTRPDDLLDAGESRAARVRAGYGSVDEGWYSSLSFAGRADDLAGALVVGRRESGAADVASRDARPNPATRSQEVVHARATLETGGGPVGLAWTWDRRNSRTDIDSLELSVGRFANTVLLRGDDTGSSTRLVLDQTLEGFPAIAQGVWRLFWQRAELEQLTEEERRPTATAAPLAIDRAFRYEESTLGGELTLAHTFDTRAGSHRLVGGLELSLSNIEELRDGSQTNLATGAVTNLLLGESMPVRDFPVSDVLKAGAYLQDEWRPGDGRWRVIAALRADLYRLDPRPDAVFREDNPSQQPVGVDTFSASPRLGLTWDIPVGGTAFLQYAHGFRSPPFEDVNIGLDLPQFNVRAIPNPDLRPEKSDSIEVGVRLNGAALGGSISAWLGRYRDFIQSKVNLGPDPASGVVLFQSRNVGRAEIRGVEATLEARLDELAPALAGMSANISLAYAQGQDLERNVPLDSIEPLRAIAGLGYLSPTGRGRLALNVAAVAPKRRVDPTTPDPLRVAGFATVELLGGWQIDERWRLDAGVFNLTDKSYLEWADVRGRAAADPLLELYRRPGRSLAVRISGSF